MTLNHHGAKIMIHAQMIEGTAEEIIRQIQQEYSGQELRVFIEPKAEGPDQDANLPEPPLTVRDRDHLVELLNEARNRSAIRLTDDTLEQMRQEVRTRIAQKQP